MSALCLTPGTRVWVTQMVIIISLGEDTVVYWTITPRSLVDGLEHFAPKRLAWNLRQHIRPKSRTRLP